MSFYMEESLRWYGSDDTVTLRDIRQTGATAVITALHHIPYGAVWPLKEIKQRKGMIEAAGLRWAAVESLPVHEEIKTRTGNYREYIKNYIESLYYIGKAGINTVIYNFMPVLDWVRTDLKYKLDDGSECLYFNPVHFAAFELFLLKRKGAKNDYSKQQLKKAEDFYQSLSDKEKQDFERSIIDVFPGTKLGLNIQDIRNMIAKYKDIDKQKLKEHFSLFLKQVIPAAKEAGVRMAVHPDDPPYSIMGLPRIVSTEDDIKDLLLTIDEPENGLSLCPGSLSPREDNYIPGMIDRYGHRINFVHLRNIHRNTDGSFYEANHLEGSVDMYTVILSLLKEQERRKKAGREDWRFTFRPDHGHTMLDDLKKPPAMNPGYTCIGRMRGLAEIRGLEMGIIRSCFLSTKDRY